MTIPTTTNNGNVAGTTTARILVGNGGDSEAWRFLHDQMFTDIAPQVNEGNENIDGTKIYTIRTPLARWMEESVVLDGPYVHDTVLALKSRITEPLEKRYQTELQVILAKKAKDEEERKRRAEERACQEAERAQATTAARATAAEDESTAMSNTTNDLQQIDNTAASETLVLASSSIDETQHVNDIVMTSPEQQHSVQLPAASETVPDISASPVHSANNEAVQIASQSEETGKDSF